jgi:4-diphosphocytidyl-2-C-methyl-D-erythritol kinase
MNSIEMVSYTKVNLTLEILSKRPDGYHEIDSIAQTIDITDDLILTKTESEKIEIECDTAGVPEGRGNIVYKACEEFLRKTGIHSGIKCLLRKRIPMQAGLGGGSGNAAAAIKGLNKLFETNLSQDRLADMAAVVGSDAPLFIYGGTVRMRGRGEIIDHLPDAPEMDLVVIKPDVGVSTVWAYDRVDKSGNRRQGASLSAENAIRSGDKSGLIACLYNDFDPVVCAEFDEIARAKAALLKAGAQAAMLSGSGSAVFGIFENKNQANQAAMNIMGEFSQVFLTKTIGRRSIIE